MIFLFWTAETKYTYKKENFLRIFSFFHVNNLLIKLTEKKETTKLLYTILQVKLFIIIIEFLNLYIEVDKEQMIYFWEHLQSQEISNKIWNNDIFIYILA